MAKVAIASKTGVNVDEHFGRAVFFRVYELTESGYSFEQSRDAVAACQHSRTHSKTDFDTIIELLSDCDAVLVQKIGEGAAGYLISKGMRVFEVSGSIDAVLNKLIEDKVFS
ncbi:MAG: dinitrogenase iron-molybdenum cofactor biosynthesis protein [Oscillospiraceae bacterium]|nr:dinitrogenase iron-molybdenum cofactor biosynthesis protein [Oscillospiraceae bacterium]